MADGLKTASLIWDKAAILRSADYDDIYFSDVDGLAETRHVFLNGNDLPDRFQSFDQNTYFSVGELGFGTGLNALLSWIEADKQRKKIYYESVEFAPISLHQAKQLNYPSLLNISSDIFLQLHQDSWNNCYSDSP